MFHSVDNGIRDRCDAALDTLHRVRTSLTTVKGSRRFAAQKKKLGSDFGRAFLQNKRRSSSLPYSQGRKATTSYTHRFVCLSNYNQETIPRTDKEKDTLLEAGLGEKKITIPDIDITSEDFRDFILEEFPKLKDGGGFMFAKCRLNSRILEPLSSLCLTSPRRLRDRVGSTRTYILPLQRDLNLSSVTELPPGVSFSMQ